MISLVAGLEEAKNICGVTFRLIQIRYSKPSLAKIFLACQADSPGPPQSLIQVAETLSAFHRYAQRNAFRRRDVRQQSKELAARTGVEPVYQP